MIRNIEAVVFPMMFYGSESCTLKKQGKKSTDTLEFCVGGHFNMNSHDEQMNCRWILSSLSKFRLYDTFCKDLASLRCQ